MAAFALLCAACCAHGDTIVVLPHGGADVRVPFQADDNGVIQDAALYVNTQEESAWGTSGDELVLHQVIFDGKCRQDVDVMIPVVRTPGSRQGAPAVRFQYAANLDRYRFLPSFNNRDLAVALPKLKELDISDLFTHERKRSSEGCVRVGTESESVTFFSVPFDEEHCCKAKHIAADVCSRAYGALPDDFRYKMCKESVDGFQCVLGTQCR